MSIKQIIKDNACCFFDGRFCVKNDHFPTGSHDIPFNFIGVRVASNDHLATDDYIIQKLNILVVKRIRIDFFCGDFDLFNARFLIRLITERYEIILHFIQPFAAKNMQQRVEKNDWYQFVLQVLDTFGGQIQVIEIGNTINRKRWSGYTRKNFLATWQIVHNETIHYKLILID